MNRIKKWFLLKRTLRNVKDYGKIVDALYDRGVKVLAWKEEEERKTRKFLENNIPMDGY